MTSIAPIIVAGGGGTRLWPLSREHYPKQFLRLGGELTLLQQTLSRLQGLKDSGGDAGGAAVILPPWIICNEEHRFLVAEQARQIAVRPSGIVLEPVGRNTAPALTCGALLSRGQPDPDPILLMMPADHLMQDPSRFQRAVLRAMALAERGFLVAFGAPAVRPETGFGYIEHGDPMRADSGPSAYEIKAFVEKPDEARARAYVEAGYYAWNCGIFMMKASVWFEALRLYHPEMLTSCERACLEASQEGDFHRLSRGDFEACPSDSIDYAVMEKLGGAGPLGAAVVTLEAGWSDVGAWSSLWEVSGRDGAGNLLQGDVCAIDARDNLVFSESRFVALLGCRDLVVVETADAVLVTPRQRSQDVKRLIAWMHSAGRVERMSHRRVYRPWGSYESVDNGERFQVKRIVVNPGAMLSLQMHHHRAEHWIVVKGTARVQRGEESFLLSENESTYIPLGVKHRLENPGTIPLEIIEVQSGPYLGEDDIVRFEDAYNRR